ncbi:MAG TPA: aldo/keto reductase [Tepidisphaeraceae bacterium]|jgi:aryl-alcohol dehydrogenase-like predicted oxidoreductase
MNDRGLTRRQFIRTSAALTGVAVLSGGIAGGETPPATAAAARTATDQVALGKTGIMLSRVGIGTGANNGRPVVTKGKEHFLKLIRHAWDSGITYIDCAKQYATFDWIGESIKDLPREKLFIQSKVWGQPDDIMATIDMHRSTFKVDYIDSLLVHCMTRPKWTDQWKRIMDGFDQAKEKKWIRAKGVSCHTLPALQDAAEKEWSEVHLVRINPKGQFMDGVRDQWGGNATPVDPVLDQIKAVHEKGRGVIGMKIFGNGTFTEAKDREESVRFSLSNPNIDAIVIGMESVEQIDENLTMINRALAA